MSVNNDSVQASGIQTYFADSHCNKVLEEISSMRLNGLLTDVVLLVEGREFRAHKNILAASSEYFKAMFLFPSEEKQINLANVSSVAVEELLDYMYQGSIELTEENIEEVLVASRLFLLDDLTQACCRFAQDRINVNNCWGIRNMADKLSLLHLLGRVNAFIEDNFNQAKGSSEFMDLPFELMQELVADDELNVREDELVSAVLKWIVYDRPGRQMYLEPLFKLLRLTYISAEVMEHLCSEDDLVSTNDFLVKLLEAMQKGQGYSQTLQDLVTYDEFLVTNKPRKWQRIVPVLTAVGGTQTLFYNTEEKLWVSLAPITTRHCPGLAGIGSKAFLVGGSHKWIRMNDCEMYSPDRNTWEDMAPMSIARSNIGLVVLEGFLYAVGGYDGNTPSRFVERYDPKKNEWKMVASMNSHRDGACVVSDNDNIFAITGFDGNNYLNTMEVYDHCKDTWVSEGYQPIVDVRQDAMAAHVNGKIYVIGGYKNQDGISSGEAYDIELNTWASIAPMSCDRNKAGCAALNRKIYICGGWEGSGNVLTSVEFYDTDTDSWTVLPSLPTPSAMRATFVHFPRKQVDILTEKSKNKKRKNIVAVITSASV